MRLHVVLEDEALRQLYKNRPSRKIDSQRLFSREYDFHKTFSLTENHFSGRTYFYTIGSRPHNEALVKLLSRLGYTTPDWLEEDLKDGKDNMTKLEEGSDEKDTKQGS